MPWSRIAYAVNTSEKHVIYKCGSLNIRIKLFGMTSSKFVRSSAKIVGFYKLLDASVKPSSQYDGENAMYGA